MSYYYYKELWVDAFIPAGPDNLRKPPSKLARPPEECKPLEGTCMLDGVGRGSEKLRLTRFGRDITDLLG